jgi:hypothetical protein
MTQTKFGGGIRPKLSLWVTVIGSSLLLACSKGTTDSSSRSGPSAPTADVQGNLAREQVDPDSGLAERLPVRSVDALCEASSVEFRRAVSPCFTDLAVCGEVLSVEFDSAGRGTSARFLTAIPGTAAPAAERVLACVNKSLGAISNRCAGMNARQYRQSCTLN